MYAYCGNNPINRVDSTGMFWEEIGDWFKNAWDDVKTWAGNTFGAGATVVQQYKQETESVPLVINQFVTIKSGTREDVTISSMGDSSKPISVYALGRSDNPLLSSAGVKINASNTTVNASIGLDNIGISGAVSNGDITNTYRMRADLSQLKVGFEISTTIKWSENTKITSYTNVSVTGWFIVSAYYLITYGQLYPATQSTY